jgi:adenylosuccinate synthase
MIRGKFNVVLGAQAGSESKGKLAAYLAAKFKPDVICMAASPNAGHTAYVGGNKYVSYCLPVSAVAHRSASIMLGPSSVINVDVLVEEMEALRIEPARVYIHPRAVTVTAGYIRREKEGGLLKIGSTNQGVGAARAAKIMREEDITFAKDVVVFKEMGMIADTVSILNNNLWEGATVLCEMSQGFDLDLEHGIDPHYCTSKMVNPAMGMAEAGVSPKWLGHVYGVLRPYPIRVNNREGSSGPYGEAEEISWDEVTRRCGSLTPITELTTTTKLLRRVFEFSKQRMRHFTRVCHPDFLALQFANYINHLDFGKTDWYDLSPETRDFSQWLSNTYAPVAYIGTSPEDMVDLHMDRGNYDSEIQNHGPISGQRPQAGM